MKNREPDEQEKQYIEAIEYWINKQRYTFLTSVSFNNWAEISVRQMAEESGCIDLYNYAYQPFSCATHNMWNHIAKYNLIESDNPLHKFFRKPAIYNFHPDFYYVELTTKYVNKMFRLFDEKIGFIPKGESSYDILMNSIDELNERSLKETQKKESLMKKNNH